MKNMLLGLMFVAFLFGCSGVDVKQDYDTSVNFQSMKTYDWLQHINRGSELVDNSLVTERVKNSVEAALLKKGYQSRSSGDVDFLVDYSYSVEKEPDSGSGASVGVGSSFSGGFGMFGMGLSRRTRISEMETLSINIFNPVDTKLIWRGFLVQELTRHSDPKDSQQDIKKLVDAILSKFPPKR